MDGGYPFCSDGGCAASPGAPVQTEEVINHPTEPSTLYLEPTTDTDVPGVPVHGSEQPSNLLHVHTQGQATPTSPFLRPLLRFIHHREDRVMGALAGLSPPPPTATLEHETMSSRTRTSTVLLHTMQNILLLGIGAWAETGSTNGVDEVTTWRKDRRSVSSTELDHILP